MCKDTVVALVEDESREPFVLEYTAGESSFKVFKAFNGTKLPVNRQVVSPKKEAEPQKAPPMVTV